jgi:hypothetical protein
MNGTNRLYGLLWTAALIACWVLLLDWGDEREQLRGEALAARGRHQRELGALEGANWAAEAARARAVRLEWLGRFPEAETPGLMRVTALEKAKSLCDEAGARCQISPVGDAIEPSAPPGPAASANASGRPPAGTQAVKLKLAFDFSPPTFLRLLGRIESGNELYAIDRLQIAGPRAEMQIAVFFVDAAQARRIRSSAADTGAGT